LKSSRAGNGEELPNGSRAGRSDDRVRSSGKPIGIEITAPTKLSLSSLKNTVRSLGLPLVKKADLAPLLAA
jgi:hypothetical protein